MKIEPMPRGFGARVTGVNLASPLTSDHFDDIYRAWLKHSLLVFPGQSLSPQQHIDFSRGFGDLEIHVFKKALLPDHPEIYRLSNIIEEGEKVGKGVTQYWHSDLSYMAVPAKASMLYGIETPAVGGDTLYADMYAAYDDLPEATRRRIQDLDVVHNFTDFPARFAKINNTTENVPVLPQDVLDTLKDVVHPMVLWHPETQRRALYLNQGFAVRCVGLPEAESDALLNELFAFSTQERYQYRHRWQPGDVVLWDNRCTVHTATGGYQAPMRRLMHRTTIRGAVPMRSPGG